jgi:hypothetical protein
MMRLIVRKCMLIVVLSIVISPGCNSLSDPDDAAVILDKGTVADMFGNHDGVASQEELAFVETYFATNSEAWCITHLPSVSTTRTGFTAEDVRTAVVSSQTTPYPSEQALRERYAGVSFRTPYISISVLRSGVQISLAGYFRSPGPRLSEAVWEPILIVS